jgi:hypothetical protein
MNCVVVVLVVATNGTWIKCSGSINGKMHSLWRAVDQDGNVLDMRVAEPPEHTSSETILSEAPQRAPLYPTRDHH